jgi:hypothetical protein
MSGRFVLNECIVGGKCVDQFGKIWYPEPDEPAIEYPAFIAICHKPKRRRVFVWDEREYGWDTAQEATSAEIKEYDYKTWTY